MIPELGHLALILALCLAIALAVVPLFGNATSQLRLQVAAHPLALGQGCMLLLAYAALTVSFIMDDFSVVYVVANSNSALPLPYKFSAVWGSHEGSLLLWVFILSLWTIAVSLLGKRLPLLMQARVLAVMGMISSGFLAFTLLTSNPFKRYLPDAAIEGADLNPLLQDFGLMIHPPMLYMGYVGFSVAFAFAIAALMDGKVDAAWARWVRPWTAMAWGFLTLGIALGSWWAYYELGWGGWWFWDPVENASLMPWLSGTALLHSLAVSEQRRLFKSWTLLLAILTFSLSLLGTFLVRSGVLTSVHAFATDPERGYFMLLLLVLCVGGSLVLYALRASTVRSRAVFNLLSRETCLLANNILLMVALAIVFLGTLYPLFLDVLGGERISVGPPYFNVLFVPIMALLLLLLGIGINVRWRAMPSQRLMHLLRQPLLWALGAGFAWPWVYAGAFNASVALAGALLVWLLATSVADLRQRVQQQNNAGSVWWKLGASYYGMLLAHIGIGFTALGIVMVSHYSVEVSLRMAPNDKVNVGGYQFIFDGVKSIDGPNYSSIQAQVQVLKNGSVQQILQPEKRHYNAGQQVMTEVAIDAGLWRDLYVAMGEPLAQDSWALRIHYKPFVRWIWLGALLMAFGAGSAAWGKRHRFILLPVAQTRHKGINS